MTFPREADMTAVAVRAAAALQAPSGAHVFLEFEATLGIADIVFARFDEKALAARADGQGSCALVDRAEAAVLWALSRLSAVDELSARLGFSASTVRTQLRALAAHGLAESSQSGWRRTVPMPGRLAEATAIELKLGDWRRALDQAARYRAFAERSLVVIAEQHSCAARTQTPVFKTNGIGLATLNSQGTVETVVRPRKLRPLDPVARFIAGERLWLEHLEQPPLAA